ncbi:YlzJ-like family protein [Alicyclobacillus curvatus]|jgi:hypothetical protein|nr:YlzJ-like family protein [Alicyclobacillus curvatus]
MSLLWSIVPTDSVFGSEATTEYMMRQVPAASATLVLSDAGGGMAKVERLISTNPNHYLKPDWQPGSLVRLADFDSISG